MGAKVTFDGLDELRAALRKLPQALAEEAGAIIDRRAQNTAAAIRAAYVKRTTGLNPTERRKTPWYAPGNLKARVTVAVERQDVAVHATVRSNAPHAALYEFGTGSLNVTHPGKDRKTATGANRGSTAPRPTVIPIAMRERKAMNTELVDVVKRAGFEVTGAL